MVSVPGTMGAFVVFRPDRAHDLLPRGVHQGPFNAAFSLSGAVVPEPSTLMMGSTAALTGLGYWWRRRRCAAT
jgi:hypothetical protein